MELLQWVVDETLGKGSSQCCEDKFYMNLMKSQRAHKFVVGTLVEKYESAHRWISPRLEGMQGETTDNQFLVELFERIPG